MTTGMDTLFERYALCALDKQHRLSRVVGKATGRLDLDHGVVTFDEPRLSLPAQVLGSESPSQHTWLWAWGQRDIVIPQPLLAASQQLHDLGAEDGIAEFLAAEVPLDEIDAPRLAMVATCVTGASAHCRCRATDNDDEAYVLINGEAIDTQAGYNATDFATDLADLIGRYAFNHRRAIEAYLTARDVAPRYGEGTCEEGEFIFALLPDDDEVHINFDGDRVTDIFCLPAGGEHEMAGGGAGRPWWKFW